MRKEVIIVSFLVVIIAVGAAIYYGTGGSNSDNVPIEAEFANKVVYTTNMSVDEEPLRANCNARGGTFNSCGSTCAPDAAVCTEVCAYTCDNIGSGTSTEENTSAQSIPDGWEQYENEAMGFSMAHPESVNVQPSEIPGQGPSVRFFEWGPTQEEGTELYDGLSITVTQVPMNAGSVKEAAEQALTSTRQAAQEVLEPVHETNLGGKTGYAFRVRSQGEHTTAFLPLSSDDDTLLRISYRAHDPTLQGFEQTLETMLETFQVTG